MKHIMSAHHAASRRMGWVMILILLLCMGTAQAQKKKSKSPAPTKQNVVATIGTYSLTLDEFERQYIRNNGGEAAAARSSMDERKEFLQLLVKYRLKVLEAREKGFDKDPDIVKELQEYRNNLAEPFFVERALADGKVKELYDMQRDEVRAAHILIRITNDTLGRPDTLTALAKANDLLKQIQAGASFEEMAAKHSEDKGTAENGGDLHFFTAGMTVPSFDNAVYSLKNKGDVLPTPVRTMFGYHLVKLLDRRPARGELQVSHILVRIPVENPTDTAAAFAKINSIADSLKKGERFADLAMRNSEDPTSGVRGGDLGWVGRRKFVPEFEMAAFSMKEGDISAPVRTQFGYHIISITGERPPKSFEEAKQETKELYRRYSFDEDKARFLDGIYARYDIRVDDAVLQKLIASVDTTATTSAPGWYNKVGDALKKERLIVLKGANVTIDDAIRTIERNQDLQSKPLNRSSLRTVAELIGRKEALRLETADLETRYPEFGSLMQEYQEGVLLFRAEQDAVWNQVKVEESGLRPFWQARASEYQWPERVRFSEIFVTSDSMSRVMRDSLDRGVPFEELAARHTQRSGFAAKQGDWGLTATDANELATRASKLQVGAVEGPVKYQYGFSIIKVTGKDVAREKTFEEAQSEISSKYQEHESKRMENEWIDGLRKKFGVTVNEALLEQAFSTLAR